MSRPLPSSSSPKTPSQEPPRPPGQARPPWRSHCPRTASPRMQVPVGDRVGMRSPRRATGLGGSWGSQPGPGFHHNRGPLKLRPLCHAYKCLLERLKPCPPSRAQPVNGSAHEAHSAPSPASGHPCFFTETSGKSPQGQCPLGATSLSPSPQGRTEWRGPSVLHRAHLCQRGLQCLPRGSQHAGSAEGRCFLPRLRQACLLLCSTLHWLPLLQATNVGLVSDGRTHSVWQALC